MNNKIISLYTFFFVLIFIFLFSVDFLYKKYVVNLTVGNHYKISATQNFGFKEDSYQKVLEDILLFDNKINDSEKDDVFKVQNFKIIKNISNYTVDNPKTLIKFDLILKEKINPNQLEKKFNEIYFMSVNEVIDTIEANRSLFDYNILNKEYQVIKSKEIDKIYDELINSEFYRKFPPAKCNTEIKKTCLKIYFDYYRYVLNYIKINSTSGDLLTFFQFADSDKISVSALVQEYYSNQTMFEKYDLLNEKDENNRIKFEFFDKKYEKFIKSKFYENYVHNPETYCRKYREGCFRQISDYFNTTLYKHKNELKNKYYVKFVNEIIKDRKFIHEIPKIMGLAIFFNYILFIFTNKFFRKKLR